jgi:predicted nuclease of predicted toxin-antitoxin system
MRFLVDAQLPTKLCEIMNAAELDAVHVDTLPDGDESSDRDIALYADQNDLIVITKDSDFYHSHMILRQPRRLLLITTGNIKNRGLFDLIRANAQTIKTLFDSCNYVELTNDSIIGHER